MLFRVGLLRQLSSEVQQGMRIANSNGNFPLARIAQPHIVQTRWISNREEKKLKRDENKVRNKFDSSDPWKRKPFKDQTAPVDVDYNSLYYTMTRPLNQKVFRFNTQIPQVLETKNENPHSLLLAEQNLSDVIEMDPSDQTPDSFNKAIHSNGLLNRVEEAEKAFQLMLDRKVTPNEITFACLMNAHANKGDVESVLKTFKQITEYQIIPNVWHYGVLMKAFVNGGRLDAAFQLFAQMKKDKIYIGQPMYSMLISGCAQAQLYDKAWEVYDSMVKEGTQIVDEVTYTAMIYICAKTQKVERAMLLLDEMYRRQLKPTDVTYNTLIYACSSRVDTYLQGFDLMNKMRTYGFVPDLMTFSSLLRGCSKAGDLANAYSIWTEMTARGIEPNAFCYTSMMFALANKKTFEIRRAKRLEYIDKLKESDKSKTMAATSSATKGGKENELDLDADAEIMDDLDQAAYEAEEELEAMLKEQREAENEFLAERDQVLLAKRLFQEIQNREILIDNVLIRAYLSVFVNNDCLEDAIQVFDVLYPRFDVSTTLNDYKRMLQLCWNVGDYPLAQAYWTKMKEDGFQPDAQAFMYLIHTASKCQKYEHALMHVELMKQKRLFPEAIELEILRKTLLQQDAAQIWDQIFPKFKGRIKLRKLRERVE